MRKKTDIFDSFKEIMGPMSSQGVILVAGKAGNPMTIGWGTIGNIWGKPVMTVMVRPSRYTFGLMEEIPQFSVNVMSKEYNKTLGLCGSKSGRDTDKIKATGLTLAKGLEIEVAYIEESLFHVECKTIFKNEVNATNLEKSIDENYYAFGDYHRIYFGEILGIYKAE